ncbi:hypothetical protein CBR_g18651 [Chara braunii]|uniref:Pre-mRNA-splicing factor SYF2 n=1 Tax=Chara braunii TaxID=69332 RepID=A0A388JTB1_CHABU|nr:hypothetical protein CBR_g18651 [Chara braunii]|eukprot:GBG61059.1 hypothetical protein CBR_g18651 [Chara braunii]
MAGLLNPRAHPDCINAGNPVHECSDYCLRKIAERRALREEQQQALLAARGGEGGGALGGGEEDGGSKGAGANSLPAAFGRVRSVKRRREGEEGRVGDGAFVAGNKRGDSIASSSTTAGEGKAAGLMPRVSSGGSWGGGAEQQQQQPHRHREDGTSGAGLGARGRAGDNGGDDDDVGPAEGDGGGDPLAGLDERGRKLFELRLKLNQARKSNQSAVVAERKREDAPPESRGMSKARWLEEREKKLGRQLEANGLDMSKAFMLDTQDEAEKKYKKWEKKSAPFGGDVFNQRTLYKAYLKRTKDVPPEAVEDYQKRKGAELEGDERGDDGAGRVVLGDGVVVHGVGLGAAQVPAENVDRMVAELGKRVSKRKAFSRRRKFYEEKDIDYINERNAHFNRKIERAFGKYTVEIKNNLERGTALPD